MDSFEVAFIDRARQGILAQYSQYSDIFRRTLYLFKLIELFWSWTKQLL